MLPGPQTSGDNVFYTFLLDFQALYKDKQLESQSTLELGMYEGKKWKSSCNKSPNIYVYGMILSTNIAIGAIAIIKKLVNIVNVCEELSDLNMNENTYVNGRIANGNMA
jgi:hypothetical protein